MNNISKGILLSTFNGFLLYLALEVLKFPETDAPAAQENVLFES